MTKQMQNYDKTRATLQIGRSNYYINIVLMSILLPQETTR